VKIELSIIIPVYNRPDDLRELLESLYFQTDKDFEVIVVDDGSSVTSETVVKNIQPFLDVKYYYKENSGASLTRNYGYEKATGNYAIFLDSDCILYKDYIQNVRLRLTNNYVDAFGGSDTAESPQRTYGGINTIKPIERITAKQKAINYAMTSLLTTGGIRRGVKTLDNWYPRSFNMGYSREVFNATGGFTGTIRPNDPDLDIDMSIRIKKLGFKIGYIKEAAVYHKRRSTFRQFSKQVYRFGKARMTLYRLHPDSLKFVYLLPLLFTLALLFGIAFNFMTPFILFALAIFIHSTLKTKNIYVGLLSVIASYIQLISYGFGFLLEYKLIGVK